MNQIRTIPIGNFTPCSVFNANYVPGKSCLLESAQTHFLIGRYSIIATNPFKSLKSYRREIYIDDYERKSQRYIKGDVLDIVYEIINQEKDKIVQLNTRTPFDYGGAIGYFGYDCVRLWEQIGEDKKRNTTVPDVFFMFYRDLIVFDHHLACIYLINNTEIQHNGTIEESAHLRTCFDSEMSEQDFSKMVYTIKEHIKEGDIYQANISQRFSAELNEHGFTIYKKLRKINPSPFAGYIDFDDLEIISCSPERLFKRDNIYIETRPIAGTYPRKSNKIEDNAMKINLTLDPKEIAEHIMLVDLERNDLGRICEYGSIVPDELMTIETYSHVHHIISHIRGNLRKGETLPSIVKALFPGGTITGCPKIRCMQIINEVEPARRDLYTGSMCFLGFGGYMDSNIIIRTIIKQKNKLTLQTGAGIVADSIPHKEYQETLYKAQALFNAVS